MGFSVFAREGVDAPAFFLSYRGVLKEDENRVAEVLSQQLIQDNREPLKLVLASVIPIRFCPWCGRNLSKTYRSSWKECLGSNL